jgi:hypothetical protein
MLTAEQIRFRRNICINVLRRCDELEESAIRWHRQGIHLPARDGFKEYHSFLPKPYLDMDLARYRAERRKYTELLRELELESQPEQLELQMERGSAPAFNALATVQSPCRKNPRKEKPWEVKHQQLFGQGISALA